MNKTILSFGLMFIFSFVMLLGTTYAWFSETITVSDNTIRTGTFDVDVMFADSKVLLENEITYDELEWFTLTENSKIFDNDYLYPGFYDERIVKVTNSGEIDAAIRFITHDSSVTDSVLLNAVDFYGFTMNSEEEFFMGGHWFLNWESYEDYEANDFLVLAPNESVTLVIGYDINSNLGNDGQEQFLQFDVTLEAIQVLEAQSREANLYYLSDLEFENNPGIPEID